MFAETDVQSEHESMSVVLLISLDVYIFQLLLKSVLLLVLYLDTCTLGVRESVFSILLCCFVAGTKANVMANLARAICS